MKIQIIIILININNDRDNIIYHNKEINENNKESKKNNQRSLSQGSVDILKKNEPTKDKELKQNIKKKKEKSNENHIIIKKIKDILPYTHVGFNGEEPKENNQDN